MKFALAGLAVLYILSACQEAALEDVKEPVPTTSILNLMLTVVTPATNTLWSIEDPQTDADWQVFIDAANDVIEVGKIIKVGGTGPNDNEWASDPAWDAFSDRLINAGVDARRAAINKDVEAMWSAGVVLYPPCEECHIQFNPGVQ